ncbi:MAG: hypothetical protein Q8928_17775 [Bacteroidota bacterium]|nr:hypothetical protein [Bacteroidota bacterium]
MFEILKYTVPSLVVFLTVFYIIRSFFEDQEKKRLQKSALKNRKLITPLRLQAYERIILFLERISIESLIIRTSQPGMTARMLQSEILSSVRAEFDHNLSQQLYLSNEAWEMVKNARANTMKITNLAADKIPADAPYSQLSTKLLEMIMEMEKTPTGVAIEFLKNEVRKLF